MFNTNKIEELESRLQNQSYKIGDLEKRLEEQDNLINQLVKLLGYGFYGKEIIIETNPNGVWFFGNKQPVYDNQPVKKQDFDLLLKQLNLEMKVTHNEPITKKIVKSK
jgi:hypothetical protein